VNLAGAGAAWNEKVDGRRNVNGRYPCLLTLSCVPPFDVVAFWPLERNSMNAE